MPNAQPVSFDVCKGQILTRLRKQTGLFRKTNVDLSETFKALSRMNRNRRGCSIVILGHDIRGAMASARVERYGEIKDTRRYFLLIFSDVLTPDSMTENQLCRRSAGDQKLLAYSQTQPANEGLALSVAV